MVRWQIAGCLVALTLFAAGCARPVEPRWADSATNGEARLFDSPRETVVLELAPDIGELRLDGVVRAATSTPVLATEAGRIVDNAVQTGDRIRIGEPVVRFQPQVDRAGALEREVLLLQRELAIEQGDDDGVARVDQSIAALDQAELGRATDITAPVAGVVLGVTDGLTSSVDIGDELFAIATSNDLVVVVDTTITRVEGVGVGDVVVARSAALGSLGVPATVAAIDSEDDSEQVELTIVPDTPLAPADLGRAIRIDVDLTPPDENDEVLWVDRRAVHRRDADSFLLIENEAGQLQRLDVRFGRRTDTHVEVREVATFESLAPGVVLVLP